jgi:carbon-monoxide dehydrogenase large subunit
MNPSNALVGSPVERVEDLRFLTGRGKYVADLASDRLLHAAILRSPLAHGRIRRIATAAAAAFPGVAAVIAAADLGNSVPLIPMRQHGVPEGERYRQPVIAHDKVRYVARDLPLTPPRLWALIEDSRARSLRARSLHARSTT